MHVAHCDRTSTEEGEKKLKNVSVKIPQKLSAATSSVHHRMVHPSTVLVLSGFLCPSPFPSHSYDTHLPTKLPFKENKRQKKKKKMAALTRGKLLVTITIVEITTVPLRLIQRSSRRTSHNLQRSNRNITLSNPPTLYMETDGNKKLIEEHPAPPPPPPPHPQPHPIKPHTTPGRCVRVTPGHQRSHKVSIKEPLTGGSLVFHTWNKLLGLWVQAAFALWKRTEYILQH